MQVLSAATIAVPCSLKSIAARVQPALPDVAQSASEAYVGSYAAVSLAGPSTFPLAERLMLGGTAAMGGMHAVMSIARLASGASRYSHHRPAGTFHMLLGASDALTAAGMFGAAAGAPHIALPLLAAGMVANLATRAAFGHYS